MNNLVTLVLKLPRDLEITGEATLNFLSSLVGINEARGIGRFFNRGNKPISLEIVLFGQQIRFELTCDRSLSEFVISQIQSSYPLVNIISAEPIRIESNFSVARLVLKNGSYYPIKTYLNFSEIDPMSSVLSVLAGAKEDENAVIQVSLRAVSSNWQQRAEYWASHGTRRENGDWMPRPDAAVIKEKIKHPGFLTSIRIASSSDDLITKIAQAFNTFTRPDGNSFRLIRPIALRKKSLTRAFNERRVNDNQILNLEEIATIWHLPSGKVKTFGIAWETKVLSEPPDNLPVFSNDHSENNKINFFAKTFFRNKEAVFGIKDSDRRRHIWAIGKTGTGKSTLIANMAIDDFKKGKGVCVVDPHGDLCETLLNYVPKNRTNEVIYFNPSDREYSIVINPLEVANKEEAELVVSGIISIFSKVFGEHWGPRIEYILRNCLLTLSETSDATLEDILPLLTNSSYRAKLIARLGDPVIRSFWKDEYENMPPVLQKEAISPILNKVGRFVTSPMIRRVTNKPRSTIKVDEIMNEGKILLVNLSQGRLGEDNAALLGAMLITKIQLAAMRRVDISEDERRDFYLYVDEFQNFATNSFIKILSEARKYRLNLMLANQYIAQIPIDVQKAILGNAGTIIAFGVGADDARILQHEFMEVFKEKDLVNILNFQIAIRLMIDGHSQRPFLATTLPILGSSNQNKETVIKVSRERWGKRVKS